MRNYALLGTGDPLANSYLLALASFYIYDLEQQGWTCCRNRFISDYKKWLKVGSNDSPVVTMIQDANTDTQVAVMSNSSDVIVVFRGTELNATDWAGNIPIPPLTTIPSPFPGPDVKVHSGWWGNLDSVYDDVKSEVIAQGAATKRIWLTGHSLGGSLAVLAGYRLQELDDINIEMIQTFGCPKVGNSAFRDFFTFSSPQLMKTQRWVNYLDPVPLLPADPGYRHVGVINNIHADHSIQWDDDEMTYVSVDPTYHRIDLRYCRYIYRKLPSDKKKKVPLTWTAGLDKVSAGFLAKPEKAYFFDGDKYTRYIPGKGADWKYPRLISDTWKKWPASWNDGVDAVVKWSNEKIYFFKGAYYLRYTPGKGVDDTYPRPILGNWNGWPINWLGGIDAAIFWPNGKAYFFKGSQYIRYTPGQGVDPNYPKVISEKWDGWPSDWSSGIDSGLLWANGKGYFFKGEKYIRYTPGKGVDSGYPKHIICHWKRLLKPA